MWLKIQDVNFVRLAICPKSTCSIALLYLANLHFNPRKVVPLSLQADPTFSQGQNTVLGDRYQLVM
jgi:hypothetical protein